MRELVVPTAVAGIHFVAAVACICSSAAGTVVSAAVLVLYDIHCSLVVGAATDVVVGMVSTVAASAARAAIVVVSVVAGTVAAGVATWVLSAAALFTPLVCPVQTCPSPSIFHYPSLSSSCSIRKRFVLRAHACTFVHVGVIPFYIREVDLFLA